MLYISIILYDFRQVGNNSPLTTERTSCLSEIIFLFTVHEIKNSSKFLQDFQNVFKKKLKKIQMKLKNPHKNAM